MKPTVLVIEDERAIRVGLCDVLAFHGYAPTGAADGREGLDQALTGRYDLLVVDVMLPEVDGFTICREVRATDPRQAILMLTARGSEGDVLEGFRAGCDDYVTKPFSVAQLVARVEALMRRVVPAQRFQIGALAIDGERLTASIDDSTHAELTRRDVELLAWLHQHRGRAVSRAELLREVWGYKRVDGVETRCVDMHIAKLRRKLERVAPRATVIETVRGAGYRVA